MCNRIIKMIGKTLFTLNKEQGQILPLVLVLLFLGAILLAPVLAYNSTTLKSTMQTESYQRELYAADAGVKIALSYLEDWNNNATFPIELTSTSGGQYNLPLLHINNKYVAVDLECVAFEESGMKAYKITSLARGTTIENYTALLPDFFFAAATSRGDVNTYGSSTVQYPDGTPAPIIENYTGTWPPVQDLKDTYKPKGLLTPQMPPPPGGLPYYPAGNVTIDAGTNPIIGPLYVNGDLIINGTGNVTLAGTVYTTGKVVIDSSINLDMNSQTIFSESTLTTDNMGNRTDRAILIGSSAYVSGSGCIIGIGDVFYEPHQTTSSDSFVLVMSVDSRVVLKPQGDFYGTVFGDAEIDIQNGTVTLTTPDPGVIDFPIDTFTNAVWSTDYWAVTRGPVGPPTITTASLPQGNVNAGYSTKLHASGGAFPYTWSKISGDWPAGSPVFSISSDGIITGTPTVTGTYADIGIQVTDSEGKTFDRYFNITIHNEIHEIIISPDSASVALRGTHDFVARAYDADGLEVPTTFTWSLPSGGGTVDTNGTYTAGYTAGNYTVKAAVGTVYDTADIEVQKMNTSTAVISSTNPSIYLNTVTFTATVTAPVGTPTGTVQFKVDGVNLGAPITLVNGVATSIATSPTLAVGNHTITALYSGDDNYFSSTGSLTQVINHKIIWGSGAGTYSVSPDGLTLSVKKNTVFTNQILVSGGTSPYTWTLVSVTPSTSGWGTQPSLSATGVFGGKVPSSAGLTFIVTVTVTDSGGVSTTQQLILTTY